MAPSTRAQSRAGARVLRSKEQVAVSTEPPAATPASVRRSKRQGDRTPPSKRASSGLATPHPREEHDVRIRPRSSASVDEDTEAEVRDAEEGEHAITSPSGSSQEEIAGRKKLGGRAAGSPPATEEGGARSVEEEEDEDVLLDAFVATFERHLAALSPARRAHASSGEPAEEGECAPPSEPPADEDLSRPAAAPPAVPPASDDIWVVDEDRRLAEDAAEKLARISWRPETGLPLGGHLSPERLAGPAALPALGGGPPGERPGAGRRPREEASAGRRPGGGGGSSRAAAARTFELEKGLEKRLLAPPRDERREARAARQLAPVTAGPKWYDLPATRITPELKQELRLLKLRSVLDPKRHYRAPDATKFPKHFQVGTVVESAADFFSGRLTKRQRKASFAEELLADPALKAYRTRKYEQIQEAKEASGKKWYKHKKEKRKPVWARK